MYHSYDFLFDYVCRRIIFKEREMKVWEYVWLLMLVVLSVILLFIDWFNKNKGGKSGAV